MRNYFYIQCNNMEEWNEAQLWLFSQGYKWPASGQSLWFPQALFKRFPLFVGCGLRPYLFWNNVRNFTRDYKEIELPKKSILFEKPKEIKL